ncbi:hypothetical protein [Tuberibacillus sp. Marseille-P3662]|uniref:hypothetical protein n=1 Tax=Tuberibacillus sp. Marseille-P3662 TaxID=1965358 RepID=UPI000A1CAAA3|nr:hypothetical protein [Tuberibacillus sp. Marseille-P3662]
MDKDRKTVSYSQLIDRQNYYKEKSLQLEKDHIFAEEKIKALEEQLERLKEDGTEYHKLKQDYDALKKAYDDVVAKHTQSEQKIAELQAAMEKLNNGQEEQAGSSNSEAYQKRVKDYERLLAEVQRDLNEKDEELSVYKKRLNILDKRLKNNGEAVLNQKPDLEKNPNKKDDCLAVGILDYAMIMNQNRCVIRGDFILQNNGTQSLGTPFVCFRFTPGDAAELKGRILGAEHVDQGQVDTQQLQWTFLENDWAQEARERGEIWVHPVSQVSIAAGEELAVSDFQVPVETKYYDHVAIEVFVYFQELDYKIKSTNQILVNL